jgi:hypothetical protein
VVPGNLPHPLPCLDLVTLVGGIEASGWRPMAVCWIIDLHMDEEGAAIIASHHQHPAVEQGCAFEGSILASWSAVTMAPVRSAPLNVSLRGGPPFSSAGHSYRIACLREPFLNILAYALYHYTTVPSAPNCDFLPKAAGSGVCSPAPADGYPGCTMEEQERAAPSPADTG